MSDISSFSAKLPVIVLLFLTEHIFTLFSDLNRLCNTNGKSLPQMENAPVCPPTSGHLMAEKMKLGRQDQGDNDAGEILSHFYFYVFLSIGWKIQVDININFHSFIQLRKEP